MWFTADLSNSKQLCSETVNHIELLNAVLNAEIHSVTLHGECAEFGYK